MFRELAPATSFMGNPLAGGDKSGKFKSQFLAEPELNYLVQMKHSFYTYFKRMFREAGRNLQAHNPNHQAPLTFRPNRVADVAKVWL